MPARQGYVYMLASRPHGTLYTGMTSDVALRVWQHRNDAAEGFSKRYRVHRLVHVEVFARVTDAITREKQLKGWNRAWKVRLIEAHNPAWADLAADWFDEAGGDVGDREQNGFPPSRE